MNAIAPNPTPELLARTAEAVSRLASQAAAMAGVAQSQVHSLRTTLPLPPASFPLPVRAPQRLLQDWGEYALDAAQRGILFWDIMREAGNTFVAHEEAGCPPVLVFRYETVLDGRTLARPVNYALVRILPPEGAAAPNPALRPFVIIDPRAGHGAGIGGFKSDSQVGVALRMGHPVYFVIFFRDPQPGQSILDVTAAEGRFLGRVRELHPDAPKPVVVGNCQGGWAVMMLGAANPDLVGPLVLNGAPLSYWAGERGKNPMRYMGGLAGGSWPAAMLADLGNGRFDGANLVMNFESLSPANTWFRKYYDVFAQADTEGPRFLEFERWWGGYFLMNDEEIRWIVENLFIGDRFAQGRLSAGRGASFDMRAMRSPVIVFASSGDNITPPGQALRWIADVWRDEAEIRQRGQTIVYLLHHDVGHLGIFVSAKVARKEHTEIATTLEMIEAVAPGLYEMRITGDGGAEGYAVELVERTIGDIRALCGEARNEAFPAVAKVSALNQHLYDVALRPLVRQATTEASAELRRRMHPLRARRWLASDSNPLMRPVAALAPLVRQHRQRAAGDNPFLAMERAWADGVERTMSTWRTLADGWVELAFHAIYGGLAAAGVADDVLEAAQDEAAAVPSALAAAPALLEAGGYAEAVIRMMILLAQARGGVRRSRLARSNALLREQAPFADLTDAARQAIIREQTALVAADPEGALAALPKLLPQAADRRRAWDAVAWVAGPEEELGAAARQMLHRQRDVLGLG